MKYLSKQIMITLLGLSVILMTGNVIAVDMDTNQVKGKQGIADYLPQANEQSAVDRLLRAKLLPSTQLLGSSTSIMVATNEGQACVSAAECTQPSINDCCYALPVGSGLTCQKHNNCIGKLSINLNQLSINLK